MGAVQNYVSVSRRPPDVEDYIDMFRRYRSWVIGPMFAGLVISVVAAFLWPDTYVSYAVMRITPQSVPANMVPSAVSTQMADRLTQMETQILSRGNLSEIITQPSLGLYKKELARRNLEDVIEDMRNRYITIKMLDLPGAANDGAHRFSSAFSIQFQYSDKYKAQEVVRKLVSNFTDQNLSESKNETDRTANFLGDERKKALEKVNDLELQVTKFQLENRGKLPEDAQGNMTAMNTLEMRLLAVQDTISQDNQEIRILESNLQTVKNNENYTQSTVETIVPGQQAKNAHLVDLSNKITDMKSQLAALLQTYEEGYPLIKTVRQQISTLEQERDALEKEFAGTPTVGPQKVTNQPAQMAVLNLQGQQKQIETQIQTKQMDVAEKSRVVEALQKQIAGYQERLSSAPASSQKYATLMHDLSVARDEFDKQTKNVNAAETAKSLEEHGAGESLEVLDAANLPQSPAAPNRMAIAGAGAAMGLMLGIVLAGAKEVKNTSLKNLKDVRAYTNLPVLSSIPLLENALLVRRKRRLFWLAWSTAVIVGSIAMSASAYYYYWGQSAS